MQLLEAASVLVAMNTDGPQAAHDSDSSSPAASGSSEREEDPPSSPESSPSPRQAHHAYRDPADNENKRYSNASVNSYSRSYQSVFSEPSSYPHDRHWSNDAGSGRPYTADASIVAASYPDEDPQELAAAVGLLSCSYGTPKIGPSGTPRADDVPPVPPLPEKYANRFQHHRGSAHVEDVIMDESSSEDDEADREQHQQRRPPRSSFQPTHEEFEGVFGKMDA